MNSDFFMQKAIELSIKNINNNGGPFGCVIVKNNKIISEGVNGVTQNNDPTAHAEIVAIRKACENLSNFFLKDCDLYATCLLYTSPSPRDRQKSRMPSSA